MTHSKYSRSKNCNPEKITDCSFFNILFYLALTIHIKLSPAWLVSEDNDNPYNIRTREVINEFESLNIPVGSGNVIFPSGNALKYLSEYFDQNVNYSSPYDEDPSDIRAIGFLPNGDVLNGNVYKDGILDILKAYQP